MNEELKKLEELFKTDEEFRAKLKAAAESCTGGQDEEAVFNGVLGKRCRNFRLIISKMQKCLVTSDAWSQL